MIENFFSNRIPILFKIIDDRCIKIKSNFYNKKLIIDQRRVKTIFQNENCLIAYQIKRKHDFEKTIMRPSIKINSKINKVFERSKKWEYKMINIKTLLNDFFKELCKKSNLFIINDKKKIFKIMNYFIKKYKEKQ